MGGVGRDQLLSKHRWAKRRERVWRKVYWCRYLFAVLVMTLIADIDWY
eukprot:NODE_14006_length_188_cov_139.539568_g13391_i0.p2 GENE.NODE_14006_length_188_cov_139.539568_g13391_i0~~NODE_14006_length_188_cov_139.539568_g13391_i0.p2  ORF type:complete len:55 (+),score=19.20 NODE_14006_length_188_cov_139.539568_g13391_i0:22-165(+)